MQRRRLWRDKGGSTVNAVVGEVLHRAVGRPLPGDLTARPDFFVIEDLPNNLRDILYVQ